MSRSLPSPSKHHSRSCFVKSSEQQVHIRWRDTPPSPAQLAAWRWLWTRLLDERHSPKNVEAPGDTIPGASATYEPDCVD
jgi:hypothetical protein